MLAVFHLKTASSIYVSTLNSQVDALFAAWNKSDSPGCSIGIIQNGKLLYGRGYGMATLEHPIALSTKSVFQIASESKQFTAMSVALLSRQGKLSLDDQIQHHLPEIGYYEEPITVRHLVHHSSGLREYFPLGRMVGFDLQNDYPDEEIIALVAAQKGLNHRPGAEHAYVNVGYILLAEIVKRVSGLNLREFAEQNIFAPLGMRHTHFRNDHMEVIPGRATGYMRRNGGFSTLMTNWDMMGDGGLWTCVDDLCLWDANFYNNVLGGFGQELIDQISTPGKLIDGQPMTYAFGLDVMRYRGLTVVDHGGRFAGYESEIMRFPEQRFSVICLSNLAGSDAKGLARKIADIYLADTFLAQADSKASAVSLKFRNLPVAELESTAGKYHDAKFGRVWELKVKDNALAIELDGQTVLGTLRAVRPNRFSLVGGVNDLEVDFEQDEWSPTNAISVSVNGARSIPFQRIQTYKSSPDELSAYTGTYHSSELEIDYNLTIQHGRIVFPIRGLGQKSLEQISKSLFQCSHGFGLLEFSTDTQGRVTGFKISTDGVRGIRFDRSSIL